MATRKKKSEPKEGHVIMLQGKEYITHIGLLDLFHKAGGQGMEGDYVYQLCDADADRYVYKARVWDSEGRDFSAMGHASPKNLNRKMVAFAAVMAETRAWNRAIRSMVNHGATTADEMQAVGLGSQPLEQQEPSRKPKEDYQPVWAFGSGFFQRICTLKGRPSFVEIEQMCEAWSKGKITVEQLSQERLAALLDKIESEDGQQMLKEIRFHNGALAPAINERSDNQ